MMMAFFSQFSWFECTLISAVLYGCLNFCYKLAAQKGLKGPVVVNKAAMTVTFWSFLFLLIDRPSIDNYQGLLLFAFLNSAFFTLSSTSKLTALKNIPTSYFFPLSKFSLAIVIILSLIFLQERPKWNEWLGIAGIASLVWLMSADNRKGREKVRHLSRGLLFTCFVALGTGFSVFVGKLASTRVDKIAYIFISYLFTMIFTYLISKMMHRKSPTPAIPGERLYAFFFGAMIGTLNFIGYILVLLAFSQGPLSLVQSISTISIILPVFLSVFFLGEPLTKRRLAMLAMAILSVLLIKAI